MYCHAIKAVSTALSKRSLHLRPRLMCWRCNDDIHSNFSQFIYQRCRRDRLTSARIAAQHNASRSRFDVGDDSANRFLLIKYQLQTLHCGCGHDVDRCRGIRCHPPAYRRPCLPHGLGSPANLDGSRCGCAEARSGPLGNRRPPLDPGSGWRAHGSGRLLGGPNSLAVALAQRKRQPLVCKAKRPQQHAAR